MDFVTYLKQYQDAQWGVDLTHAQIQGDCVAGRAHFQVALGFPVQDIQQALSERLSQWLLQHPQVQEAQVQVDWSVKAHAVQPGVKALPGVKNVIAVSAAKGGVGKSTVAVNLALALKAQGAQVGLFDADIHGPSQPILLGTTEQPQSQDRKSLEPVTVHGLQTMSIGYLLEAADTPMVWRGPIATRALQQLLNDTRWHDLDYLIMDLPPGTGDIPLTLAQKVPLTGAVLVTTPQVLALRDVQRGLVMWRKVHVSVLGVVENMARFDCSHCGESTALFGEGGGERLAEEYEIPMLGALPLDPVFNDQAQAGVPVLTAQPQGALAQVYGTLARRAAVQVAAKKRDYSRHMPTVVVE